MVVDRNKGLDGSSSPETDKAGKQSASPEWADGLRSLYDSVVEEPLPDSFKDLLAQLDKGSPTKASPGKDQ